MNSKDFYLALAEKKLIGSSCQVCGLQQVPQRKLCPQCHAENTQITTFSGKGTLAAFTVIRVPPMHMARAGYGSKTPYCVGIVALEEGPSVSAQILNVDLANPDEISIGMPLRMTTIKRESDPSERTYLAFEPC